MDTQDIPNLEGALPSENSSPSDRNSDIPKSIDDASADLESLLNIEQKFYDEGFEDGLKHGKGQGLIEGRTIGREKVFEMWEELGFYEGFALLWQAVITSQNRDTGRAAHHIRQLLDLIKQFPQANPPESSDVDIPKMFRQVRSRYKALCSSLGVKPSLRAAEASPLHEPDAGDAIQAGSGREGVADSVWRLDDQPKGHSAQGLDF